MRINQKKGPTLQRSSLQNHQLNKLLSSISHRHPPKLSEFDDQTVSRTPLIHLQRTPALQSREDPQQYDSLRRQLIKSRIKSKVREGLQMASKQLFQRKSYDLQSHNGSAILPSQAKGHFYVLPAYKPHQLQEIIANCVIQSVSLHQKPPRRSAAVRSRIINSVIQRRTLVKPAIPSRNKQSTPHLENPEGVEPWRYMEDTEDGSFLRNNRMH